MADIRWKISLIDLGRALDRLGEILQKPITEEHDGYIDGSIHRFEIAIELYWKTFKHLLALEGIVTSSPRESMQGAYKVGWIADEKLWLSMLNDRNLTAHTYREETAWQIYCNIKEYYPVFKELYEKLVQKYNLES